MGTSLFPPRSVVGSQGFDAQCDRAFELLGSTADAVLIVPPFAGLDFPSLGIHLLQAAVRAGLRVPILYANLLLRRWAAISSIAQYAGQDTARCGANGFSPPPPSAFHPWDMKSKNERPALQPKRGPGRRDNFRRAGGVGTRGRAVLLRPRQAFRRAPFPRGRR